MRVRFGALVAGDLLEIADYLAGQGMDQPERFLEKLETACRRLGPMPHRFSFVPGFETLSVRHRVIGNYVIFYRVTTDEVVILRIRHGASDYGDALTESDAE